MLFKAQAKGSRLRVLRAERKVSQRNVAQGCGIQFDRYWRIENGYANPTPDELAALAKAFGVAPDAIAEAN